ncbi:MAG TPA: zinc ribbon domain-containing protein [Candidatus Mcinerneyibacterium sp.]|nr:zinc ribbon domain-containing protein [Candidatus Mcinerneyibacterium sp.]
MNTKEYKCPKCGNLTFKTDQMRATGGGFSKIFDVQNKKFTTISCEKCGYTEFYKAETSTLGNIFDFFTN